MEEPRSTRHLKRAEVAGASTAPTAPTAPKRRRIACVGEAPLELRSEEHEVAPPLLLPYPDSPEKVSAPSEAGDFVSSSSSSSGPSEPPRSSGRSDEDSVDVVKEKKFDMVGDDRQQQAKSFETEASTCNRDFSRETTPSERRPSAAETPSRGELESFFSAAEECERQRFAEKYNYDVAMDAPLDGRYEWIRLKP
ncbi:cyclin-dependent kinase inhibitor 7 isoform X2 [Eucalyptus grandis]|uniref:cyclin-dependent kinase inhibitor 7 isoform X2 n=1 Tax=Eucalyptus grandis TaxID=71139 RepID=UPI00192EA219|nr:cyclin-dependent kinase inhibitor 7 isoform X2 [Eucalyptus grandis]